MPSFKHYSDAQPQLTFNYVFVGALRKYTLIYLRTTLSYEHCYKSRSRYTHTTNMLIQTEHEIYTNNTQKYNDPEFLYVTVRRLDLAISKLFLKLN